MSALPLESAVQAAIEGRGCQCGGAMVDAYRVTIDRLLEARDRDWAQLEAYRAEIRELHAQLNDAWGHDPEDDDADRADHEWAHRASAGVSL